MKIANSKYADKYENNKYIWENEADKNSDAAKKANKENEEIRKMYGVNDDTASYQDFKLMRRNSSPYYEAASNVRPDTKYKNASEKLYNAINNFFYDAENDPMYRAYSNAMKRESDLAQKNVYANLSKLSGGRNNSYASSAVAQVGQTYATKAADYAKTLADEAYNRLLEKYKLSVEREKSDADEKEKQYDMLMKLAEADVQAKRSAAEDRQKEAENNLDYAIKLDEYQAQLIKNGILNEKNKYEFEKWQKDPYYEIKDKELAKEIGRYNAYNWLLSNAPGYFNNVYLK